MSHGSGNFSIWTTDKNDQSQRKHRKICNFIYFCSLESSRSITYSLFHQTIIFTYYDVLYKDLVTHNLCNLNRCKVSNCYRDLVRFPSQDQKNKMKQNFYLSLFSFIKNVRLLVVMDHLAHYNLLRYLSVIVFVCLNVKVRLLESEV